MKAYKGFDKDLKCRGFRYEIGAEYEEETADLCSCGFHACENPLSTLSYYPPDASRYCEVELDGVTEQSEPDTKRCGTKIKVKAEIGILGIVRASVKYIKERCKVNESSCATTGYGAHAATTGDGAHAATTGDRAHAATTGYGAHAATTGDRAHAATTGKNTVAVSVGLNSSAAAPLGSYIALADWRKAGNEWKLCGGRFVLVDGEQVKPDTYYKLLDGELAEENE